eukprot:COSAG06_NODE_631_length_13616_cov_6.997411_9_plen_83_part_00
MCFITSDDPSAQSSEGEAAEVQAEPASDVTVRVRGRGGEHTKERTAKVYGLSAPALVLDPEELQAAQRRQEPAQALPPTRRG